MGAFCSLMLLSGLLNEFLTTLSFLSVGVSAVTLATRSFRDGLLGGFRDAFMLIGPFGDNKSLSETTGSPSPPLFCLMSLIMLASCFEEAGTMSLTCSPERMSGSSTTYIY